MITLRLSLVSTLLVLTTMGLGGCAADPEGGEGDATEAEISTEIATPSAGEVAPMRIGYVPRVTREDIRSGGGSCAGNLCTINGTMWNCTGGGYCSVIQF
jgi:hypothetical protein